MAQYFQLRAYVDLARRWTSWGEHAAEGDGHAATGAENETADRLLALARRARRADAVLLASGCGSSGGGSYEPIEVGGSSCCPRRVEGPAIEAATKDGWKARFWAGVNLGVDGARPSARARSRPSAGRTTTAGSRASGRSAPASSASTRSCGPTSTTRSPPTTGSTRTGRCSSSRASGSPRRSSSTTQNAYAADRHRGFEAEIDDAVAVVHGDAEAAGAPRPRRRGRTARTSRRGCSPGRSESSGTRRAVESTDRLNAGHDAVRGPVHRGATPTRRRWRAGSRRMLDHIAAARGRARLEPSDDVHQLAHGRPARPPLRAARRRRTSSRSTRRTSRRPTPGPAGSSPATTPTRTTPTSCA